MLTLLTSLCASYTHTPLALYALKAYAVSREPDLAEEILIESFTINQTDGFILRGIYRRKPDAVGFSCYGWNMEKTVRVASALRKLLPGIKIIFGGPEMAAEHEEYLARGIADAVIRGEGEQAFYEWLADWRSRQKGTGSAKRGDIPAAVPLDLSRLPFPYPRDLSGLENKIIYYEASRGCPFSCGYCLSSVEGAPRLRPIADVRRHMKIFLDAKVPRVKLTDRTFNAVESFALEIWGFLIENDNGVTNFHFEIAADLLSEKALALLERARPGLFQFEIGVQSTNGYALAEVSRATDVLRLLSTVRRIRSFRNIHLHLDLIAGLPGEGLESFKKSFNDVYDTRPDQIQLGFLKLLKGTRLRERAGEWGIVYGQYPPYEVLRTRWLSYDDLLALKDVAEMAGVFYNSGKFTWTLTYLVKYFASYYAFYESLADYWRERGYFNAPNGKWLAHDALYGFCEKYCADETEREIILDFMRFDLYANENERGAPECFGKKRVGVSRGGRPERGRDYRVEFFRFDLLAWVVGIYGENPPPPARRENFLRFEYPDVGRQSAFTLLDRVKEEGMR